MDELDLFRGFRSGVAAPSRVAERRASDRLSRAIERGLGPRPSGPRPIRKRAALAVAVLAGAAATALVAGAQWRSSPGFLERAEAALTPPEGSILHVVWETTRTSADFGCATISGPNELWADQAPPYRFRLVSHDAPASLARGDSRTVACTAGSPVETVGAAPMQGWLGFVPHGQGQSDPVTALREAIRDGLAHDEGRTELDGRVVERIRIDAPSDCSGPPCPPPEAGYAYVDPETFAPVRRETPNGLAMVGAPGGASLRFDTVDRFLTYEYLPRTAGNRALTE